MVPSFTELLTTVDSKPVGNKDAFVGMIGGVSKVLTAASPPEEPESSEAILSLFKIFEAPVTSLCEDVALTMFVTVSRRLFKIVLSPMYEVVK